MLGFLLVVAFSHLSLKAHTPRRTPRMMSAPFPALADALPFDIDSTLLSDDIQYRGFGVSLEGRDEYTSVQSAFERQIPARLRKFTVSDMTLLPADGRGVMVGRYTVSFEAPVPPQIMPEQRRRLARANLTRTADGRAPVEARVACTLQIDPTTGLVCRHTETLAVDPFAVTATIAHFEYCYARQLALYAARSDGAKLSLLTVAVAYVRALRELTRRELNEVVKENRRNSDELSVLTGGDIDADVSDEEFNSWVRHGRSNSKT